MAGRGGAVVALAAGLERKVGGGPVTVQVGAGSAVLVVWAAPWGVLAATRAHRSSIRNAHRRRA